MIIEKEVDGERVRYYVYEPLPLGTIPTADFTNLIICSALGLNQELLKFVKQKEEETANKGIEISFDLGSSSGDYQVNS